MSNLKEIADIITKHECGITVTEALEKGICVECKQPAIPNCYSIDGFKEFNLSGICEKCFDDLFKDTEDL